MKKYFFTGLVTLLPIALTFLIARYLFNLFTAPFVQLVEKLIISYEQSHGIDLAHHQLLVLSISRTLVFIFLILLTFLLGFLAQKFFFRFFLDKVTLLVYRIPFVGTIYKISHDLAKAVFKQGEKTFKRTVLVPFPTPKTHSIGFVTGDIPPKLKEFIQGTDLIVFVPTAPHPISGFMLLTPKKETIETDISVEESFKFIVSCGLIRPEDNVKT